jgi:diacylglycerol kinase
MYLCVRVSILTLSTILILILELSNSSLSNIVSRENDIARKHNA